MEINRVVVREKNLKPVQHPPNFQTKKYAAVEKKEVVTFAFQHNIVTEQDKIGVILPGFPNGMMAKDIILKELQTIVQLFSQLTMMLETKQSSEQMVKQLVNHIQAMMKQVQMEDIPLLDGTYDFLVVLHKGKQLTLTLLDMNPFLHTVERDPSEVYRVISAITMYIKELEHDDTWTKGLSFPRNEKNAMVWRALAEMSMTKLMQQWKEEVQERKWSAALFLLLIWMICMYII